MTEHFIVFSKPDCPACEKTKILLKKEGHVFTEFDVSKNEGLMEFLRLSGFRSLPQVYLNGKLIGGYQSLMDYLKVWQ